MALSLKGTGIATNLVMCLAVDDDGVTIKEFVSSDVNANKTIDAGVTVGLASWKGTNRSYISILDNTFDYKGVRFAAGHRPSLDAGSGHPFSFFAALSGASDPGGTNAFIEASAAGTWLAIRSTTDKLVDDVQGAGHASTTSLPDDGTTKFSCGYSHTFGSAYAAYYGLESGALAADGSGADAGFGGDATPILGVGGATGQGSQPGNYHVICLFNKALSLGEFQSLHGDGVDDWFTTLFAASGGGGGLPAGAESAYFPGGMQPQTSPLTISKW